MAQRKKRQVRRTATGKQRGSSKRKGRSSGGRGYSTDFKLKVVEQVVRRRVSLDRVAQAFGVGRATLAGWVTLYREGGPDALRPRPRKPRPPTARDRRHVAIEELKQEHPEYGTRRIRDVLERFAGLGVSETVVRRVLHEAGLMEPTRQAGPARQRPPRRFERAQPNQMWQSDIFTFLLRRHERLYLTAFMDDHSRFLVSHALAHHQKSALVMEALERGIAAFGPPREVLTDNGRQYTAWRGTTVFEETLRREGIHHIKSRPQHPQTLGKVERFWKTLWDEFLSRTVFADFDDCARRLKLFIDAYNFQRPHQALGGLTPADRYFRAAPQVRAAIERTIAENALRLAHQRPTVKPFYIVGRMGDRDLSIAADAGGLRVQLGDETPQRIDIGKEQQHEREEIQSRFATSSGQEPQPQGPSTTDTEVAVGAAGLGRDGAPPLSDDSQCAQWGEAGERADSGSADVAWDLLPTGDESAERDAASTDAGLTLGGYERERGLAQTHRGAAETGGALGEGEATCGASAAADPGPGASWEDDDDGREKTEDFETPALEDAWQRAFEDLDEAEAELDRSVERLDDYEEQLGTDADAAHYGWRGRALGWDRKLTGAVAPVDAPGPGGRDELEEEEPLEQPEVILRPGPVHRGTVRGPLHAGDDGGDQASEHQRSGEEPGHEPQPLPDAAAPERGSGDTSSHAPIRWTQVTLGEGSGAGAAGGGAAAGEREAAEPGGDLRPIARCGETDAEGKSPTDATGAGDAVEEDSEESSRDGTGWRGS